MKSDNKVYWRSLDGLAGSEELQRLSENEFPPAAEGELSSESEEDGPSRRNFMQLMGASVALAGAAGAAGCRRWEEEKIVPLAKRTHDYLPGVPKYYATAMEVGGVATGILATAFDGRPVKVEGNPDHPWSGSGSSAFAQASILDLYDPDRSQSVIRTEGGKVMGGDWVSFEDAAQQLANRGPGLKLRVLSEATSSPTMQAMRAALGGRYRQMQWHEWEPLSFDNEREGMKLAFGKPYRPVYDLTKADVVLSLDSDFLVDHPGASGFAQRYAVRRNPDGGPMNRVYAVESTHSSTGAVADHRLPLRSELALPFAMALQANVGGGAAPSSAFLSDAKVAKFLGALSSDFKAAKGRSLVIAGHRQPPEVHALAAALNQGSAAVTYVDLEELESPRDSHLTSIQKLAKDLAAGQVDALLILGGNPAFNAPADLKFAELIGKAKVSIHLGLSRNETGRLCNWHLPRAHYLESWADGLAWDGTYTVTQPIIEPLYKGRTPVEICSLLAGRKVSSGRELVKEMHNLVSKAPLGTTEKTWRKTLHDGFLGRPVIKRATPSARPITPKLSARQQGGLKLGKGDVEIVFTASSHAYDGRYANNAWLLETPDFMTKATWDNVALISPQTAKQLGVDNYTMIELAVENGTPVKIPAYVMPGQAPYSIAIQVGLGRNYAGQVGGHKEHGVAAVGHDVYPARTTAGQFITQGTLKTTGSNYAIATTQDHWDLGSAERQTIEDRMGDLIRYSDIDQYKKHGASWQDDKYPRHLPRLKVESLWTDPHKYDGDRWGMATDLAKCIGCNACAVACQAENNIPIVGKREVMRSREMNWIRIDRYFAGDMDDPDVVHQPVTCQQCEKAPCEQVCPVGATIHSDEGLNDMVYNRCVGTRYCMNNCPYKVRRFNFFDYHKELEDPKNKVVKLSYNPEVTVRSRGVMEKCTFCVQRIQNVKIPKTNKGEAVKDGEIQTACQQACPTGAIVFGNLNDKDSDGKPASAVGKLHANPRAYEMLHEFNVAPRNLYLAAISNPNPTLAPAAPKKSH